MYAQTLIRYSQKNEKFHFIKAISQSSPQKYTSNSTR